MGLHKYQCLFLISRCHSPSATPFFVMFALIVYCAIIKKSSREYMPGHTQLNYVLDNTPHTHPTPLWEGQISEDEEFSLFIHVYLWHTGKQGPAQIYCQRLNIFFSLANFITTCLDNPCHCHDDHAQSSLLNQYILHVFDIDFDSLASWHTL